MKRTFADRAYNRIVERLPNKVAGSLDRYWPSIAYSWGGPLNGQQGRREIVREIRGLFGIDVVLETGTYRGTSTEFFANVFGSKVVTVEGHERFFTYSRKRLAFDSDIEVLLSDSRQFLRDMTTRLPADTTVFIYLDAHWGQDLPLKEELEVIGGHWNNCVVMIDDFKVPDDSDYGFDDYGPGRALSAEYLPWCDLKGWEIFYPKMKGNVETGKKRGSCVLGSPPMLSGLKSLESLRQVGGAV